VIDLDLGNSLTLKEGCDNSIVDFETVNEQESDQLTIWVGNLPDVF